MVDPLEEQDGIADVVEADVGEAGNGLLGLLHDARHRAVRAGYDDAVLPVVFDPLRPDDRAPFRRERSRRRQVGLEQRVGEQDQQLAVHVRLRQLDRPRGSVLHGLDDVVDGQVRIRLRHVPADDFVEMADDEHHLRDPEAQQLVEQMGEDRSPGHAHQRLGQEVRVGPQPRSLARKRNDGFHAVAQCEVCGISWILTGRMEIGRAPA